LLHGAYGHFNDWLSKTPNKTLIQQLSDQYNIIIVARGETFSFYLDSLLIKSQFETYITSEVVHKIDNTYRTINDRKVASLQVCLWVVMEQCTCQLNPELFSAAGNEWRG
jgi:hypothetical protein